MKTDWKRKRLGASYLHGIQWRQIRVGKPIEPVVVIRVLDDMKPGDEIVMTARDLRFAVDGMAYAGVNVAPLAPAVAAGQILRNRH